MIRRVLYVHRGSTPKSPSFAAQLEGVSVDTHAVPYDAKAKGVAAVFALANLARYDAIVASEYYLVWALALRLSKAGLKAPLIAVGFNQSARLMRTGQRLIDRQLNRIWRRVACFVVHSRDEASLFAGAHDIPPEKFAFIHWGYDLPVFERGGFTSPYPRFVSMIGRNNRDIDLFFRAVSQAETNGILVTSAYMMSPALKAATPANITVLLDVTMGLCLDIVAQSAAHLVLVIDGMRGAGHISAVSAMLLKKPQVFSAVAPLDDYLIDGFNGIGVPIDDVNATASAIRRLLADASLSDKFGVNGQDLARNWMSDAHSAKRIATVVQSILDRTALVDDDWRAVRPALPTA